MEHLPSRHKAPSSIPATGKKKKKTELKVLVENDSASTEHHTGTEQTENQSIKEKATGFLPPAGCMQPDLSVGL